MGNPTSIVEELFETLPKLRSQMYFKTSLTALSHAMEDQVLAGTEGAPLIIASFQQERFYRQEAHRYARISELSNHVYVLCAADTQFNETVDGYEKISFDEEDALSKEWHLVVLSEGYSAALICREHPGPGPKAPKSTSKSLVGGTMPHLDQTRRFEGIWTLDRQVSQWAADALLRRIVDYRPELQDKVDRARSQFLPPNLVAIPEEAMAVGADPFAQRLITYLQAGQYKQLKAYRAIALQEQRARLINSVTAAIRQSLNPEEIFAIATRELGSALEIDRCIIYRCAPNDADTTIQHEHRKAHLSALQGSLWPLKDNPLYQWVKRYHRPLAIDDILSELPADPPAHFAIPSSAKAATAAAATAQSPPAVQDPVDGDVMPALISEQLISDQNADLLVEAMEPVAFDFASAVPRLQRWQIRGCLLVPLLHKQRLLGMVELHLDQGSHHWNDDEIMLTEAITDQLSVALIQAEAYAHLEDLNQQLAALERTRSNLIAITGHELRTPLSTIRVCLESLMSEPDMAPELRNVMLETALTDAERMRKLVQDFLTLSRLESRRVEWNLESLALRECIDLALSSLRWHDHAQSTTSPHIHIDLPKGLPLVRADGEWIVEVLSKLIDNACKFTDADGTVTISARATSSKTVEVVVKDTGRGIEADRLETVFERFYQEEGALRRSVGGTGLGLAICQQIIEGHGGRIWATSAGKNLGSEIHFTLPAAGRSTSKTIRRGRRLPPAEGSAPEAADRGPSPRKSASPSAGPSASPSASPSAGQSSASLRNETPAEANPSQASSKSTAKSSSPKSSAKSAKGSR